MPRIDKRPRKWQKGVRRGPWSAPMPWETSYGVALWAGRDLRIAAHTFRGTRLEGHGLLFLSSDGAPVAVGVLRHWNPEQCFGPLNPKAYRFGVAHISGWAGELWNVRRHENGEVTVQPQVMPGYVLRCESVGEMAARVREDEMRHVAATSASSSARLLAAISGLGAEISEQAAKRGFEGLRCSLRLWSRNLWPVLALQHPDMPQEALIWPRIDVRLRHGRRYLVAGQRGALPRSGQPWGDPDSRDWFVVGVFDRWRGETGWHIVPRGAVRGVVGAQRAKWQLADGSNVATIGVSLPGAAAGILAGIRAAVPSRS